MSRRKLLLVDSFLLLALAPVCALAADVKPQSSTRYLCHNDPFQDSLNELDNTVVFPGNKADFFR